MYLKDHWNRFCIIGPTVHEDTMHNMGLYPKNATTLVKCYNTIYLSYLPTNAIFIGIWHKNGLKWIIIDSTHN